MCKMSLILLGPPRANIFDGISTHRISLSPKTKSCHDTNFVVTDGTAGERQPVTPQWRHHYNSQFSVVRQQYN